MSDTAKTENKAAAANAAVITQALESIARQLAEIDHDKPVIDDLDNIREIDKLATDIRSQAANIRNLTVKRLVADGTFTQKTMAEDQGISVQAVSRAIKSAKTGDDA